MGDCAEFFGGFLADFWRILTVQRPMCAGALMGRTVNTIIIITIIIERGTGTAS